MKKRILTLVLLINATIIYSQSNTFPSQGDVGIGTTTPNAKLHIKGGVLKLQGNGSNPPADKFWSIYHNASTTNAYGLNFTYNNITKVRFFKGSSDFIFYFDGNLRTKEVLVKPNIWSDFVFEKDYDLPSIEEVEMHIKKEGRLKDIPSTEEVLKNGIELGEMDAKLLQKIEELTLYIIELEKRIKNLESKEK